MRHYVAAIALAALGCHELPPPRTISFGDDLPAEVIAGAYAARDAWCAAPVGWCPDLIDDGGESEIVIDSWETEAGPDDEYGAWAHNDNAFIGVSREALSWGTVTAEMWACALSHEFGHYAINGHLSDGDSLMRPVIHDPHTCSPVVDDATITAWCDAQGC